MGIDPLDGQKIHKSPPIVQYEEKQESDHEQESAVSVVDDDEAKEFNEKIRINRYMKEMESLKDELYGKERQIDQLKLENDDAKQDADRRINELIAQNDSLQSEKDRLTSDLQQYTITHIEKEVKNENGKLLNQMKKENEELKAKYRQSNDALQQMEQSKLALLKIFNSEMDRMREEIKKLN